MIFKTSIRGRVYKFKDVKEVLAKAKEDILAVYDLPTYYRK